MNYTRLARYTHPRDFQPSELSLLLGLDQGVRARTGRSVFHSHNVSKPVVFPAPSHSPALLTGAPRFPRACCWAPGCRVMKLQVWPGVGWAKRRHALQVIFGVFLAFLQQIHISKSDPGETNGCNTVTPSVGAKGEISTARTGRRVAVLSVGLRVGYCQQVAVWVQRRCFLVLGSNVSGVIR